MKIFAEINESDFKKTILRWSKLTEKGIDEGVELAARSTAAKLAHTVQPHGLTQAVGQKFMDNIRRQVTQVYIGLGVWGGDPYNRDLESAYQLQRKNGKIRPRKITMEQGQRWQPPTPESELESLVGKQQAKAGRAKASWFSAGQLVNGKRIQAKMGKWVKRHIGKGYAAAKKIGSGMKLVIELENQTPYLSNIQSDSDLQTALRRGRSAALSSLNTAIRAQLKKAKQ